MNTLNSIKEKRKFVTPEFSLHTWSDLEPYYNNLIEREINSFEEFMKWLEDWNEVSAVIDEDLAWRYIGMTCDTNDQGIANKYQTFITEINPKISPATNILCKKYYESPFRNSISAEEFKNFDRMIAKEIEMYREENNALFSDTGVKSQEYDNLVANLTIEHDGKTITLQQASVYLESHDAVLRETIWKKIQNTRLAVSPQIDDIMQYLVEKRTQIAKNAGFESFTDYMFKKLGRFDYGRKECEAFHDSIEKIIKPIYIHLNEIRKAKLGSLKPWDLAVDIMGGSPLKPFEGGEELLSKTINLFDKMNPELGSMIKTMKEMKHLDLSSRIGKAPGGYNYPLAETGIPFIFMNAVGTQNDLSTMVHEAGHAIHSFVTKDLEFNAFKEVPSEVAELASMSMELISMDYWDIFYNSEDLKRAIYDQVCGTITILPWIATVDLFQTWMYDNPNVSPNERREAFVKIHKRFHGDSVDWTGFETIKSNIWQKQGHIFDVPFYYIEYGIAQLGALQVWQNYKQNKEKGIQDYLSALKLGYTKSIPEIYATANISFEFSGDKIKQLSDFVMNSIKVFE